jgi:predicted ATP-grasp superfamily ATP-dependent carboligase
MSDSLEDKVREASCLSPVAGDELTPWNSPPATRQVTYDALVLDARLKQSLATVRSLGSRGLRVAALGTSAGLPAFSSRWCQQAFVCPTEEGAEDYMVYLEQLLDHVGVGVLITSSDATTALIRQHRERLERRVRIALAKEPALGIAINKEQTLEVAQRLGLGVPRGVSVGAVSDLEAALHKIGLPAVVKPVESWVLSKQQPMGLASKLVTTPEEAWRAVEDLANLGVTGLFQQYLSGRRESISILYAHGQIYARYAQWHKRSHPHLGGQSVLRQSIAVPPDIGDQAERLVREIELEGCSEVEFRRDDAGRPYLMEINPRLWASTELAVRSGVDFPYLLYQWASGEKIDMVKGYRVGGWMRHLSRDIMATLAVVRQRGRPVVPPPARAILDFYFSFFMPTEYDYVDWRDPLPAWKASAGFARYVLQGVGKRLSRRGSL